MMSRRTYQEQADALRREYESKYGPITSPDAYGDGRWDWINAPWPWENPKEAR